MFKIVNDNRWQKVWQTGREHGIYGSVVEYKTYYAAAEGKVLAEIWRSGEPYAPKWFGERQAWFDTVSEAKAYIRRELKKA